MGMLNQQFNNGQYLYPTTQAVPNGQQVVIPQITIPQNLASYYPQAFSQQNLQAASTVRQSRFTTVDNGIDGVKQLPTEANTDYYVFSTQDDVFWVKRTDKNNYPESLRRFRFFEEEEPVPEPPPEYVTMDEFRKFKEEMLNGQQSVRSQSGTHEAKQYTSK